MTVTAETTSTPAQRHARALVALVIVVLTAFVAVGVGVDAHASTPTVEVGGNAVAAQDVDAAPVVAASEDIAAGEGRGTTTPEPQVVSGFRVAPQTIGAADDIVRYDPQWASRQVLGQNLPGSSGWAVTPGGRTISAHAAERIALGGAGRPPTSLSMVDDILGSGSRVVYDPTRNTIRVIAENMPGNPYVVVSSSNPNHVVTVMAPYG